MGIRGLGLVAAFWGSGVVPFALAQEAAEAAEPEEVAAAAGTEAEDEAAGPIPPELEAEARSRFELGTSLYHQGRAEEALVEFQKAYRISDRPELLYNIYLCHRDIGELRQAIQALSGYLGAVTGHVPERGILERRLSSMREQIAAEERAQQSEAEARRAAADAEERARNVEMRIVEPSRVGPGLLLGVGGAAILAGAGLGVSTLFLHDELEQECFGGSCPTWKHDELEQLRRRAIAFDVLMGVGAALAISGLVWWLVDGPREVPMAAACGPLGCRVEGRF